MSPRLPASSFSAGAPTPEGRELTAAEQGAFRRRRIQPIVGVAAVVIVIAVVFGGLGAGTNQSGQGSRPRRQIEYYKNGNKKTEGFYSKHFESGDWTRYFWDGPIESLGPRSFGVRQGPWQMFFASGSKEAVEFYSNGVAAGHFVTWYENGQIESDTLYRAGLEQGQRQRWHSNGQRASLGPG